MFQLLFRGLFLSLYFLSLFLCFCFPFLCFFVYVAVFVVRLLVVGLVGLLSCSVVGVGGRAIVLLLCFAKEGGGGCVYVSVSVCHCAGECVVHMRACVWGGGCILIISDNA